MTQAALRVERSGSDSDESQVLKRVDELYAACGRGDLPAIRSFYSPDVTAFDCPPKLRLRGRDEYMKSYDKWFISAFEFPVRFETRERKVDVSGNLAVVHCLTHVTGTFKETGETASCWLRHTATYEKRGGEWLITHEHNSVPVDPDMKALMDIHPDQDRAV